LRILKLLNKLRQIECARRKSTLRPALKYPNMYLNKSTENIVLNNLSIYYLIDKIM